MTTEDRTLLEAVAVLNQRLLAADRKRILDEIRKWSTVHNGAIVVYSLLSELERLVDPDWLTVTPTAIVEPTP